MTLDKRPRRDFIKLVRARAVWWRSAVFAIALSGGASAQGFHGYYPIPRLAGQQPEYMKNQLEAFVEHRRTNNIMFNVAHELSPGMIAALAADFRALTPPPLGGGAKSLVPTGEKIFQNGLPEANVAACA